MLQRSVTLPPPLVLLRDQFVNYWNRLAPRERRYASIAIAVVTVLLLWTIAIQPAWRTLSTAPKQLDALDAQLQQMQSLAGETRDLRAAPPVSPSQATAALRAASDRLGSRAGLTLQGERATLNLTGVQGPQLIAWLSEIRIAARARVSEAQLSRGPEGYTGNIVIALGAAS